MKRGNSYYNRSEVTEIEKLLRRMESSYRERGATRNVAVITPYSAQITELQERILPASSFWTALEIEIATVDAFQGRDRDIVVYSTVRSNAEYDLGFLKDRRRLNVALSRARQLLIIVGDMLTLENGHVYMGDNPYEHIARYMRDNPDDCMISQMEQYAP
jgi:superfamily I DNA and/or RNA helicase